MLVELQEANLYDPDEAAAVSRSRDTWNWYASDEASTDDDSLWLVNTERLVPYVGVKPQLEDPPGIIWLQETVFAIVHDGPIETIEEMQRAILSARLVSVAFGLLTIAGVFWSGYSFGGTRAAALSALVCAANIVLIYHARLATASIVYCGFAVMAMAAGLWAMRPLRPHASVARQAIGWMICGAAIGFATLTTGPTAGPAITIPLLVIVLLCPHRISNMLGLVAAHAIAGLVIVPWSIQVHAHNPDIWTIWLAQLWPEGGISGIFEHLHRRALVMLLIMLPWTIWLIGALLQPFSASSAGERQRSFIGFGWFIATALVLLVLPQSHASADAGEPLRGAVAQMLLLVPVASVFIGQLFNQYAQLAEAGRYPRIWRMLRWPHLALLLVASITAALMYQAQIFLMERDYIDESLVINPGILYWIGLGVVLVALVGISARWAVREFPVRALVCWSAWSIVLAFVLWIPMTRSPMMQRQPPVAGGTITQSPAD